MNAIGTHTGAARSLTPFGKARHHAPALVYLLFDQPSFLGLTLSVRFSNNAKLSKLLI